MEDIRAKLMREMSHPDNPEFSPELDAYLAGSDRHNLRPAPLENPPVSPEDLIGPGLLKLGAKGLRSAATLMRRPVDVYSQARREFLRGKTQGASQAAPEVATDLGAAVAEPVQDIATQTVPRRDFLKGAAAIGGAGAAGVLVPKSLTTLAKVLEPAVAKDAGLLGAKVAAKVFDPAAITGPVNKWLTSRAGKSWLANAEWDISPKELQGILAKTTSKPEVVEIMRQMDEKYGAEGAQDLLKRVLTQQDEFYGTLHNVSDPRKNPMYADIYKQVDADHRLFKNKEIQQLEAGLEKAKKILASPTSSAMQKAKAEETLRRESAITGMRERFNSGEDVISSRAHAKWSPILDKEIYNPAIEWSRANAPLVEEYIATGKPPKGMPKQFENNVHFELDPIRASGPKSHAQQLHELFNLDIGPLLESSW